MAQIGKTWLFVPAKEKYAKRIPQIEADAIILDLEDSLSPSQKEDGLRIAAEVLERYGESRELYVRLNSGERFDGELNALKDIKFTGVMIPKFEDAALCEKYREQLKEKSVIALIESPRGIISLPEIAAHPLIGGLAFGGEDYRKELGFEAGEEAAFFARGQLVLYASCYRKYSLDTVSMEIRDMEKFMEDYRGSKKLGFSGKLLIHPAQAGAVKDYYRQNDGEYLRGIVEAFEKCSDGILRIDGKWYEKPHIEKIKKYLLELETKQ